MKKVHYSNIDKTLTDLLYRKVARFIVCLIARWVLIASGKTAAHETGRSKHRSSSEEELVGLPIT